MPKRTSTIEQTTTRANSADRASGSLVRPKLLAISTDLPWPLDSGYRIRQFENLRGLSEFADVTVISFSEEDDPAPALDELRTMLPAVTVLEPVPLLIHIKDDPAKLARAVATGFATGRPYKIAKFSSPEMRTRLRELCRTERFDAIHVELATMMYADVVAKSSGAPASVTLDEYNVEWQLLADHARSGAMGRLGAGVRLEAWRTRRYEANACARADAVVAISEEDAAELSELSGGQAAVYVVPPVASTARAVHRADSAHGGSVVFVGQLSWLPNQEALLWFCDSVLPALKSRRPDITIEVVGGGAPAELEASIRRAGATPLGYVEDLDEVYRRAAVFVAPFLTAGGVRIKLLEAMQAGIPVVTTAAGARGLAAQPGRDLILADTAEEFAAGIERLLEDETLRTEMIQSARAYLGAHHSHAHLTRQLERAYSGLIESRAQEDGRRIEQSVASPLATVEQS